MATHKSKRGKQAEKNRGLIPENTLEENYSYEQVLFLKTVCSVKEKHHNYNKKLGWHWINYYDPDEVGKWLSNFEKNDDSQCI